LEVVEEGMMVAVRERKRNMIGRVFVEQNLGLADLFESLGLPLKAWNLCCPSSY
jgi:hypothetical protein